MKYGKTIKGDYEYKQGDDLSQVEQIIGYVYIDENATLELPRCTSIGGAVDIYDNAKLNLPRCKSVGRSVDINENAKLNLPQCTSIGRYVYIRKNATLELPRCTSIGETVEIYANAKLNLPRCTSIGRTVYIRENATLALPQCTSIGGSVEVRENATLELPRCTSIGGSVEVRENATFKHRKDLIEHDKEANFNSFFQSGFLFADGILAKILKIRNNNIFKIQICGKVETSWCIRQGNEFAHGKTLKEAKESLIYKLSDRDTSKYADLSHESVITKAEAIQMYRAITGACEQGTRNFVESLDNPPEKLTIKELIVLTKGQYNNEKMIDFFLIKQKEIKK